MTPPPVTPGDVLVVGCGYLGRPAALRWRADGRRVFAVTRGRADDLRRDGLTPIVGDVLDPPSLALPPVKLLLYAVGFDRSAGRPMRDVYVQGLANVLAAVTAERVVYVSSTGVYGRTDGGPVDEDTPPDPLEPSGRVVLEAEQTLRRARPDAVILRFAGIYGPGRVLRRAALLAGEPLVGDADKWLNLIHVEDGVQAVRLAESARPGATYNVADGTPVTRRAFYTRTAEGLGAPPAAFLPGGTGAEPNRRVVATRVREELGFAPRYPSYLVGLDAC